MSRDIRFTTEFTSRATFREFVLGAGGGDGTWELLDDDGTVLDEAVVEDGIISFSRPEQSEEA